MGGYQKIEKDDDSFTPVVIDMNEHANTSNPAPQQSYPTYAQPSSYGNPVAAPAVHMPQVIPQANAQPVLLVQQQPALPRPLAHKCRLFRKCFKKSTIAVVDQGNEVSEAKLPINGGFLNSLEMNQSYFPEFEPFFTREEHAQLCMEVNSVLASLGFKHRKVVVGTTVVLFFFCPFAGLLVGGLAAALVRRRDRKAIKAVDAWLKKRNEDTFRARGVVWHLGPEGVTVTLPTGTVFSPCAPEDFAEYELARREEQARQAAAAQQATLLEMQQQQQIYQQQQQQQIYQQLQFQQQQQRSAQPMPQAQPMPMPQMQTMPAPQMQAMPVQNMQMYAVPQQPLQQHQMQSLTPYGQQMMMQQMAAQQQRSGSMYPGNVNNA